MAPSETSILPPVTWSTQTHWFLRMSHPHHLPPLHQPRHLYKPAMGGGDDLKLQVAFSGSVPSSNVNSYTMGIIGVAFLLVVSIIYNHHG
mmetsp:Transcript_41772/g.48734  ORF Transcript_41772/g.48734 Transcript_41772/m.48734 type:complete len:90 (+) Transcript_41772:3-272(+)